MLVSVVTGSKDQTINVLDANNYTSLLVVDCETTLRGSRCPRIRSVCFNADKKALLVGTFGSEIYELQTNTSALSSTSKFGKIRDLMSGHFTPNAKWTNEVWGLAVFNDNERYATCSDDGTLRIWSIKKRHLMDVFDLNTGNLIPGFTS